MLGRVIGSASRGVTALGLAAVMAAPAAGVSPWSPVRNSAPQRQLAPTDERRPIHVAGFPHRGTEPRDSERLLGEFVELHTAMRYERAATVAARLVELAPDRAEAHYNHACVMSRLHRRPEAMASLERAVDSGWRDLVHLLIDPDLDAVRDTAAFARLSARLKTLIREEREAALAAPAPGPEDRRQVPAILERHDAAAATVAVVEQGRMDWIGGFGDQRLAAAQAGIWQRLTTLAVEAGVPAAPPPGGVRLTASGAGLTATARMTEGARRAGLSARVLLDDGVELVEVRDPAGPGTALMWWSAETGRAVVVVASGAGADEAAGAIARHLLLAEGGKTGKSRVSADPVVN